MTRSPGRRKWFVASVVFSLVGVVVTILLLWSASRSRHATAADTAAPRQESVRFQVGDTSLAGVLLLPPTPGPHPALVFVNEAGAADRTGGGVVATLTQHLARRGIACLAWDRPGVGESSGDFATQSIADRAAEALAAVHFLQARGDIQRGKVGVAGFGQGGIVAPLAAAQSRDVAYVVALAACQLVAHEQEPLHVARELHADGFGEQAHAEALELTKLRIELLRGSGLYQELDETQKGFLGRPWFEYIGYWDRKRFDSGKLTIDYEPAPSWEKVHCPVLAVFAKKDPSCPVESSVAVIRKGLDKAGNNDVTIKVIAKADHSFAVSDTGGRKEARERAKRRPSGEAVELAPGYLDAVSGWLDARFVPRR
jgi:dienelactone hydrolase